MSKVEKLKVNEKEGQKVCDIKAKKFCARNRLKNGMLNSLLQVSINVSAVASQEVKAVVKIARCRKVNFDNCQHYLSET